MAPDSRRTSASQRQWKLSWWDLWPLVEGEQRPLQWTRNSLILSPHPSSPIVLARIFPSSSPFPLPSPNPILNNPTGYSSPTVIEVSSNDEYIFAFFDGKGNDAVACVWHHEDMIDTWKVNICWHVKPGQGIVLAKWLGEERMWLPTMPPTRAPPLGPSSQLGPMTLLLVSQSHTAQVVHRPSPSLPFQLVAASLRHASQVNAGDRPQMGESTSGPGGLSVCARAAVGIGYNESSIIIATSSRLIPPPAVSLTDFSNPFDVANSSSLPSSLSPVESLWDSSGPEQIIRLCEVKITMHGFILGITTTPILPIFPPVVSSSRLTGILMVPVLPLTSTATSPEGSVVDNDKANGSPSDSLFHVVLSFLGFEDYTSPRSELVSFELQRNTSAADGSSDVPAWRHRHLVTRTFHKSVVSFMLSSRVPGASSVTACLLDFEGVASKASPKSASKEIAIGKMAVLKVPELDDDPSWESSPLMARLEDADLDPPMSAAVSPGGSLICTSPAALSGVSKLGIHVHPRQTSAVPQLADSLLSALLLDRPTSDLLHLLLNQSLPFSSVTEILEHVLRVLDSEDFSTRDWHSSVLGFMVEIFRGRSKKLSDNNPSEVKEKATLEDRWQAAMNICSLMALIGAFDACREEDIGYNLEPVWQLIALSTWLIDFVERTLRSCISFQGDYAFFRGEKLSTEIHSKSANVKDIVSVKVEAMDIDHNNLFDGQSFSENDPFPEGASPHLLHVLHPFVLENLTMAVSHLNAFCAYIDTLQASAVKASIAKDVLMDLIDCSGIDFKQLAAGLAKAKEEVSSIDDDILRRCFCSLTPLPSTYDVLQKVCKAITSEDVVSKPRLIVKQVDLVDSVSNLSIAAAKMRHERDVVSKGILGAPGKVRVCMRCHGRTETGRTPLPRGKEASDFACWAVWEHEWGRCICGGLWVQDRSR